MVRVLKAAAVATCIAALAGPSAAQTIARKDAFVASPDGALVHSGSGLRFPKEIAGFRLVGNAVFDLSGEYVGIRYVNALAKDARLEMRVAVVHISQMTPKEHFTIMKPLGLRDLTDVRKIAEGPYERDGAASGYRGLYTAATNGRPTMVGLWAFDRGYWDLRARAEFPTAYRTKAEKAVGEFVGQLNAINKSKKGQAR